jgi:hypothetical protein
MNKITVLFPGGFKPLTGAHLALANRYAQDPQVEQVIMLIGPKDRDGITREKTTEIFNLANENPKIQMQPTNHNSPIMAAYEYLFDLPENATGRFAMAASTKGDDYVRAKSFVPNVDKYITIGDKSGRKMPQGIDAIELSIDVDPINDATGNPISATTVRQALAQDDYETFRGAYPNLNDAIVKNIWQVLRGVQEASVFSRDWWSNAIKEDIDEVVEAVMNTTERNRHNRKIAKLQTYLDNNRGKEFVYDFDEFEPTVIGTKILTHESATPKGNTRIKCKKCPHSWPANTGGKDLYVCHECGTDNTPELKESKILTEGGAAGHMSHPYDSHGLTFNDMKELVARSLAGRLDIEEAVTEKTDGQNIQVTWKNGQPGFARNKSTIINPFTPEQLIADFERKYSESVEKYGEEASAGYRNVVEAYRACAEDLTEAMNQIDSDRLDQIFKNGRVFANMEIIFPATQNVIAYDVAHLQFHNLVEYDEQANIVETDMTGGKLMQQIIQDANAHMQKTFSFIAPQRIKLGRVADFEDQQAAFFNEIDQLKNRFNLKDTDMISDYHKAWWGDVIRSRAQQLNYTIPENILTALIYRWAFFDKSTNIAMLKKQIDNPEFANWVTEFDKNEFKQYYKQNMEPFESIFLRLGSVVLRNATNFLAANPNKTVQSIKADLTALIKELQASPNPQVIAKLKMELKRIEKLGGFDAIVPAEGLVFVFHGHTYKFTGAFAPVNQILGTLKYMR